MPPSTAKALGDAAGVAGAAGDDDGDHDDDTPRGDCREDLPGEEKGSFTGEG